MIKIGGYGMSINLEKFINKKDTEQILIQKIEYNHHNKLCLFSYDLINEGYRSGWGYRLINIDTMKDITDKYNFYRNLFTNKHY